MSRRLHWLGQAALAYEEAGQFLDAARCREASAEPLPAGELYERAGDWERAAICYLRAGRVGEAVRCHLVRGRPEAAAACWEQVRRPLDAAWILVLAARQPQRARWLLRGHAPVTLGERLRHDVAAGLCAALTGDHAILVDGLRAVERDLARVQPVAERLLVERWAVDAATEVARYDLAALVFAASHRSGLRGAAERWRQWAVGALGGTAGIPAETNERRAG